MLLRSGLPGRRLGFALLLGLSLAAIAALAPLSGRGGPDRVGWSDDLPAARRAAAAGRKALLFDFTADWCPACQELRRTTWSDEGVAAAIATHCIPVRVDIDAHPDLGRRYAADYLPLLVLTDADGRELRRSVGYLSPDEFRRWVAGGG